MPFEEVGMKKLLPNKKKGFTLLEVLIATVVISVLAALVIPRVLHQVEKAKVAEAVTNLGAIRSAELLLHNLTGQFVAADDDAGIESALGLSFKGLFYEYKVINANEENFLASATPLGLLENWLEEVKIDKNGFVGSSSGDSGGGGGGGDGGGGGGGGGDGGAGGGGGGGGGEGGGGSSGGSSEGSNTSTSSNSSNANNPPLITASGPVFNGYAPTVQTVLDTLTLSTFALSSPLMQSGAYLSQWLQDNSVVVTFGNPGAGAGAVTQWNNNNHVPYITIDSEYQENKYVCAMYLAHEAVHALWLMDSYVQATQGVYQYGVPNPLYGDSRTNGLYGLDGGKDTIDNEYNAYITGAQVWVDLKTRYDVGLNAAGYAQGADSQAANFVNNDGTLKDESVAKEWIRNVEVTPGGEKLYANLPEY